MDKNRTLIVGSIGLDTIETVSDRKESILGGSATYATIAAGKSSSVHLVGIVGSDFPVNAMKIFEQSTVDLSNLGLTDDEVSMISPLFGKESLLARRFKTFNLSFALSRHAEQLLLSCLCSKINVHSHK